MWTGGFKNMNTYRLTPGTLEKSQISKDSWKKIIQLLGQSCKLHIYWKDVEHGFEHDVDSSYGL